MLRKAPRHSVDFIFPLALFFVFAVSALCVLLFATRIYQNVAAHSARNDTARIALAYLTEKLRQNDADASPRIGSLEGCEALILEHEAEGERFYTYIYVQDTELKELFVKDGTPVQAALGRTVATVAGFTMEQTAEGLFRFCCLDEDGGQATALVGVRSHPSEEMQEAQEGGGV